MFKILVLVNRVIRGSAPTYLESLFTHARRNYRLRSNDCENTPPLVVRRRRTKLAYGTPKLPYMFIFLFVVLKRPVVLHKREVVVYKKQVVMYIKKVVMVELQVVMYSLGLSC